MRKVRGGGEEEHEAVGVFVTEPVDDLLTRRPHHRPVQPLERPHTGPPYRR